MARREQPEIIPAMSNASPRTEQRQNIHVGRYVTNVQQPIETIDKRTNKYKQHLLYEYNCQPIE